MECEVIKALCELILDQILEVEYEFKKAHMEEYARYEQLFIVAINGKHDELNMREIIALANKKKSAHPVLPTLYRACNQLNDNRNPVTVQL